jgi:NAD-specific glutamate dehydrogenase
MPPVLNEMYLGARLEKSNEGETTLAAMFVEIWAIAMMNMARISRAGISPVSRVTRTTGSQIASSKTTMVAAVTAIPMKEKAVIVSGRPRACPMTCERWVFA